MIAPDKSTLIITVYNQAPQLSLILKTVALQSVQGFDVIVADDGSSDGAEKVVEKFKEKYPEIDIRYLWHEDGGFRKPIIQNKAFCASTKTYLIMIDGDMLLDKFFIENHLRFAHPRKVLCGHRGIKLNEAYTNKLVSGELTFNGSVLNIICRGMLGDLRCATRAFRIENKLLRRWIIKPRKGLGGCNFSIYRDALIAVNGMNEAISEYGYEDYELGHRLKNAGYEIVNVSRLCNTFHLYHFSRKVDGVKEIIKNINRQKHVRCEFGIRDERAS